MSTTSIDYISGSSYRPYFFLTHSSTGAIVTTGTVLLIVFEQQSDGTLWKLDTNDNTFKSTGHTSIVTTMTHQTSDGTATGLWEADVDLTDFTNDTTYYFYVPGIANVVPQMRKMQYYSSGPPAGEVILSDTAHGGGSATLYLANLAINNTSNLENPGGGTNYDAVYIRAGTGNGVYIDSASGPGVSLAASNNNALKVSNTSSTYAASYIYNDTGTAFEVHNDSSSDAAFHVINDDDNGDSFVMSGDVTSGTWTAGGVNLGSSITAIKTVTDQVTIDGSGNITNIQPIDVDGVDYSDMMTAMMAVMFGVAEVSGSSVLFKERDGTTTKVTITYNTTDGERVTSTMA